MNIIEQSKQFTSRELYKLTKAESVSIKELVGTTIKPVAWCIREDVNQSGDEVRVWSALLEDGTVVSTISDTFIKGFQDILDCFVDEELPAIVITTGMSSKGREYVDCTID